MHQISSNSSERIFLLKRCMCQQKGLFCFMQYHLPCVEIHVAHVAGDKQRIHSEAIRLKMLQIHESHSLSRQLQQAGNFGWEFWVMVMGSGWWWWALPWFVRFQRCQWVTGSYLSIYHIYQPAFINHHKSISRKTRHEYAWILTPCISQRFPAHSNSVSHIVPKARKDWFP